MTREAQVLNLLADYCKHNSEIIGAGVRRSKKGKLIAFFYINNPDVRNKLPKSIEELSVYFYDKYGKLIKD